MAEDSARRREIEAERRRHREASERGRKHAERGRHFHEGMAQLRENGWRYQHSTTTDLGVRRHDTARILDANDQRFSEYKSGNRVEGKDTLDQVRKDALLIEAGWHGQWVMTDIAWQHIDKTIGDRLRELHDRFPERFQVVVVSRAEREKAIRLGKELDRSRNQLELVNSEAPRARQRQREHAERAKEIARTQEAAARALKAREQAERDHTRERERQELAARQKDLGRVVAQNTRAIALSRTEWVPFAARELHDTHQSVTRALGEVRADEQAQTRELLGEIGVGGESARIMAEILSKGRERQREGVTRGIEAIGREAQDRERACGSRARAARRAASGTSAGPGGTGAPTGAPGRNNRRAGEGAVVHRAGSGITGRHHASCRARARSRGLPAAGTGTSTRRAGTRAVSGTGVGITPEDNHRTATPPDECLGPGPRTSTFVELVSVIEDRPDATRANDQPNPHRCTASSTCSADKPRQ